jgi:SAM-dependent methyltransferase
VNNKAVKIKWNSTVDDRPNPESPRIKFNLNFSKKYLEGKKRILDIGCGIGNYTYLIDGNDCFGIDVDIDALKTAKRYCSNSNFIIASVLNLPFKDEIFDLVLMWGVIEYIESETEKNAIQEIHRTLATGANFLLSAPNYHFIYNIVDPEHFFRRRQRHIKIKKLIKLITETGFSIMQQTVRGSWKTIIAMNVFYLYKHLLHKKGGRIQRFLDKKSEEELDTKMNGITNIFIAAKKIYR